MEDKNNLRGEYCFEINKWNINDNMYSNNQIKDIVTFPQVVEVFKSKNIIRNIDEDVIIKNNLHRKQPGDHKLFEV